MRRGGRKALPDLPDPVGQVVSAPDPARGTPGLLDLMGEVSGPVQEVMKQLDNLDPSIVSSQATLSSFATEIARVYQVPERYLYPAVRSPSTIEEVWAAQIRGSDWERRVRVDISTFWNEVGRLQRRFWRQMWSRAPRRLRVMLAQDRRITPPRRSRGWRRHVRRGKATGRRTR